MASKIIFGHNKQYETVLESGTLETLCSRREDRCLKFALKAAISERFGHWFTPTESSERAVRGTTRKVYKERLARTKRMQNSPLNAMTRALNVYHSTET